MAQSADSVRKMEAMLDILLGSVQMPNQMPNQMFDFSSLENADTPKYDSKKIPVKVKDIEFMRKYVEGGKLKITETNAEYLLEQNPNIFQGINLELVDEDDDDYFEVS